MYLNGVLVRLEARSFTTQNVKMVATEITMASCDGRKQRTTLVAPKYEIIKGGGQGYKKP